MIDMDRVLRAVAAGDQVGFCIDCGHEHEGVEPDATGYRCQACGEDAVAGAEAIVRAAHLS